MCHSIEDMPRGCGKFNCHGLLFLLNYQIIITSCLNFFIIITLLCPLGRIRPKRIHLRIPPRRRRDSTGLHAADTLRHACIDFFTYSDDHPSRLSGLCPSRERSLPSRRGHVDLPIISSGFEMAEGLRGLYKCFVDRVE